MEPLSSSSRTALAEAAAHYQLNLVEALPYLLARGINPGTAEKFRLGVVRDPITGHEQYVSRLCIPSLGVDDRPYGIRFRALHDEEPKYMSMPGAPSRLFNPRALLRPGDAIHITEGEIDAITLEQAGFHAVGVPGANTWRRHHARLFAGYSKVYIWGDGDKAGQQFARTVFDALDTGVVVALKSGLDVNDLYLAEGIEGLWRALGLEDE